MADRLSVAAERAPVDAGRAAVPALGPSALALAPVLLLLLAFFVAPLALDASESLRLGRGGPTLAEYIHIFGDAYYVQVIAQTLLLGLVVSAICAVLGYPLAYAISRLSGLPKALLVFAVIAPLLVNVVVRSYGWMVILSGAGLVNWLLRGLGLPGVELMYSWTGVTIALVHVLLPFMVLSIASALETLDPSLAEAALVLGAAPARVFRHVILPLSLEGVVTGSILCFTLTIGSFVTVMLLGKTSTMVMPLLIYQQLTVASDWPFAAAMGVALMVIVTTVLWAQSRLRPRRRA